MSRVWVEGPGTAELPSDLLTYSGPRRTGGAEARDPATGALRAVRRLLLTLTLTIPLTLTLALTLTLPRRAPLRWLKPRSHSWSRRRPSERCAVPQLPHTLPTTLLQRFPSTMSSTVLHSPLILSVDGLSIGVAGERAFFEFGDRAAHGMAFPAEILPMWSRLYCVHPIK